MVPSRSPSRPLALWPLGLSEAGGGNSKKKKTPTTFPTTFPREGGLWPGTWSAPRGGGGWRGCTRASMTFTKRHTTTWIDRSALQVRLRALSVPSDCNRSPRGASAGLVSWRQRLGRGGGGARMVGEDPSGHSRSVGEIAEPRVRAAHEHIICILGAAAGAGEAMDGGQWIDMRGFCPGFVHPERRWDTLRCP